MESEFAERAIHLAADRHRHSRSRLLCARHVYAAAERAEYRFRDAGGGVRDGDAARLRQPRARRSRRVRRRHAGGSVAVRQGKCAGGTAVVPGSVLFGAVRHCADYFGRARNMAKYAGRAFETRVASGDKRDRADPQRDRGRENQRRLTMASEDNSANLPRGADWPSRLRGAWHVLLGRLGADADTGRGLPIYDRTAAHPQALLIESLIGGLPGPAIVLDHDGRVIAFNAAASAIAPSLRRGEPALITLRMPELVDAIRRATANRMPQRVEFFERVPLDRWFEAFVVPVRLANGGDAQSELLLMTFNDLSPLRRVEEMRADFIANASHELRTPLAALLGFIETLQGPAKNDPAARDKFLAIMQGQATRMARLIDDLLSLSRIELNAHLQPNTPVDLAPIVRQVADGLQTLARDRDVEIKVTAPAEPLVVLGDRDELIRALENLVENALKYGAAGKRVDIALSRAQTRAGAPEARVAVRDYGPGIAPEHLPRLTERFYRVDVADSRAQGGTGLGLAPVSYVLNRLGGRISIESTLGAGATFIMHLPLPTADSVALRELS